MHRVSLVSLLALAFLVLASPARAQGQPVEVSAHPAAPLPGQKVRFTVTNHGTELVQALATCIVHQGDCTGSEVVALSLPAGLQLPSDGSYTITWDQLDQSGQPVPTGDYTLEFLYTSGTTPGTQSACGTASVQLPAAPVLRLDGVTSVQKLLNDPLEILVSAGPSGVGQPVTLFADIGPGPITVGGVTLPVGGTPAMVASPLGTISPLGTLSVSLPMPNHPDLAGLQIYFFAAIPNAAAPLGVDVTNGADLTLVDRTAQLAGNTLVPAKYPFFQHVTAFNAGSPVELGLDTTRYPQVVDKTADMYVVAAKTRAEWLADRSLTDVRGAPGTVTFTSAGIQGNTFLLDLGTLNGNTGDTGMGVPYDVVLDFDRDGQFDMDGDDLADGFSDTEAGFYVVHDLGQPGPLAVSSVEYDLGGSFMQQIVYYPTDIAQMGQLPLAVVAHGNGHNFLWYPHIGNHLASYGYVVMSHANNTGPGPATAAQSTFNNVDGFLANLGSIAGGVLQGHVDGSRMAWIGHSRGGEGVTIAYHRMFIGATESAFFETSDIQFVTAIAPTDFTGFARAHPHTIPYHVWVGQADTDVHGCADTDLTQSYQLHDRAEQTRQTISLYGAGHGDFHAAFGQSPWAGGPNLIGRASTHQIMLPYLLSLVKHYVEGNVPAKDYLWRQYESFHAISSPVGPSFVVNLTMREGDAEATKLVIDDFQSNPESNLASSGAAVSSTVIALAEGHLDDNDIAFNWVATDPFNGFTNNGDGVDDSAGVVFSFDGAQQYELTYQLLPSQKRFDQFTYLSFRAAQGTRHPFTQAVLGDLSFRVTLRDGAGNESSVDIDAYGGGLEEPYQRNEQPTCGFGAFGWNSEFETIRIRLSDFIRNGRALDLADIEQLVFQFPPPVMGRVGMDDIELVK